MRRGTLIAIVALLALLLITALFQYLAGQKHVRYPGPGNGTSYPPTSPRSIAPSP